MLDRLERPGGPSPDAGWILRTRLKDAELATPPSEIGRWRSTGEVLHLLQGLGVYELLGLLWHFHFATTAQLDALLSVDAAAPLGVLRSLKVVQSTKHGEVTVNRLCDQEDLARLSRILGPDRREVITGWREPLGSAWGHVRHDLLAVETVVALLASNPLLRLHGIGGAVASAQLLKKMYGVGGHPMGNGVPRADAVLNHAGGRVVFVEVTATARRQQLRRKFLRWLRALELEVRQHTVGVLLVNACQPEEHDKASDLHTNLLRGLREDIRQELHFLTAGYEVDERLATLRPIDGWTLCQIELGS